MGSGCLDERTTPGAVLRTATNTVEASLLMMRIGERTVRSYLASLRARIASYISPSNCASGREESSQWIS
jgi:hypothetical protein